jgi:hypothetical protein
MLWINKNCFLPHVIILIMIKTQLINEHSILKYIHYQATKYLQQETNSMAVANRSLLLLLLKIMKEEE